METKCPYCELGCSRCMNGLIDSVSMSVSGEVSMDETLIEDKFKTKTLELITKLLKGEYEIKYGYEERMNQMGFFVNGVFVGRALDDVVDYLLYQRV